MNITKETIRTLCEDLELKASSAETYPTDDHIQRQCGYAKAEVLREVAQAISWCLLGEDR
jgi:hypothetical protein